MAYVAARKSCYPTDSPPDRRLCKQPCDPAQLPCRPQLAALVRQQLPGGQGGLTPSGLKLDLDHMQALLQLSALEPQILSSCIAHVLPMRPDLLPGLAEPIMRLACKVLSPEPSGVMHQALEQLAGSVLAQPCVRALHGVLCIAGQLLEGGQAAEPAFEQQDADPPQCLHTSTCMQLVSRVVDALSVLEDKPPSGEPDHAGAGARHSSYGGAPQWHDPAGSRSSCTDCLVALFNVCHKLGLAGSQLLTRAVSRITALAAAFPWDALAPAVERVYDDVYERDAVRAAADSGLQPMLGKALQVCHSAIVANTHDLLCADCLLACCI